MRLTNKYNLPPGIVQAIENDPYDPGEGTWMSVTSLIKPPQIVALTKGHGDEITEDVSDRLWSLLGQSVHEVMARKDGGGQLPYRALVTKEKRLFANCLGKKISGQFDTLSLDAVEGEIVLSDYKVTSWYAVKDGAKREWVEQLNILAWLLEKNGYPKPARLEVHAMLRDYSNATAKREKNYPPCPFVVLPVPEMRHVETFVEDLIRGHQAANPRPCTNEERWAQGECWAVMKTGLRTALKLFQSQDEAMAYQERKTDRKLFQSEDPDGNQYRRVQVRQRLYIQHRPPVYRRCEDYCQVAAWCDQWKTESIK